MHTFMPRTIVAPMYIILSSNHEYENGVVVFQAGDWSAGDWPSRRILNAKELCVRTQRYHSTSNSKSLTVIGPAAPV